LNCLINELRRIDFFKKYFCCFFQDIQFVTGKDVLELINVFNANSLPEIMWKLPLLSFVITYFRLDKKYFASNFLNTLWNAWNDFLCVSLLFIGILTRTNLWQKNNLVLGWLNSLEYQKRYMYRLKVVIKERKITRWAEKSMQILSYLLW